MNFNEIQDLIKLVGKTGVSEVKIEQQEFKITIKGEHKYAEPTVVYQAQAPQPTQAPQPAVQSAPSVDLVKSPTANDDSHLIMVKSPMIGTFYRSSSPDKPSFVNVGDTLSKGQVVCVIEAMKLFNDIESEISGKIVKVLVDNASPVEYDQPLFLVDPS